MKYEIGNKFECKKTYLYDGVILWQIGKEYTIINVYKTSDKPYNMNTDLITSVLVSEEIIKNYFIVDDSISNYDYAMGIV